MLRRCAVGIRLWVYPESAKPAMLLDFRELRYDPCIMLRGTPASENALTDRLSIRFSWPTVLT
jgi:hypothetical protein